MTPSANLQNPTAPAGPIPPRRLRLHHSAQRLNEVITPPTLRKRTAAPTATIFGSATPQEARTKP